MQKNHQACNVDQKPVVSTTKPHTFMRSKNIFSPLLMLMAGCFVFFLCGCKKEQRTKTYTIYTPVYKTRAEVLADVNGNGPTPIQKAGKIYVKDNYIYLNEIDKGIHVIDNTDPSHPTQVAFLDIPGNQDIAVKGNILYADMYADLLALDISDLSHVTVTDTLHNLFTGRMYVNNTFAASDLVIIDWIAKDTTVVIDPNTPWTQCVSCPCPNCSLDNLTPGIAFFNASAASSQGKSNGVAGSMARMVLMGDHLYALAESHTLGIIDVSDAAKPVIKSTTWAGLDLETIYPFEDKLFLGSSMGMFIFDLSNPEQPVKQGEFSHGRACDPVVTDGKYAYVTLHAGTYCGGDANELNVVDIKDLMNPSLVKSYALTKPTGLCKDGDLLFVCDDASGVRVYDATDVSNLKQLQHLDSDTPYDIIAGNNHALVVGKDGVYQYDYSDLNNIRQLSFFSLKN